MSGKTRPANVGVRVVKGFDMPDNIDLISKALTPTQVEPEEKRNASEWITQPYDMRGLRALVNQSTVLPQCIRAYKSNIPGYGIGVRYKDDVEETPEMSSEFERATEILDLLNLDMDTKEVFEDLIEAREIYGISYLEVIRNVGGEVSQIEFVKDTPSITKTRPLEPYQDAVFWYNGKQETRPKKYMKYRQQSGGKTVYFKEFGDKRIMDKRTGLYVDELDIEFQANEILEFAIGTEPYGEVRWMGQTLSVDGMRKAENLNHNYFVNGRHTPLMIMIQGGTLTEESFEKLQMYMNDIKGENGQHAFIVLETESTDNSLEFETTTQPTIEVKDLASILQQDELFQAYLDNGRKKVQSAFLLPDLYVGYTSDFNRATAQTAQEVTEKQVFQPERKTYALTLDTKRAVGTYADGTEVVYHGRIIGCVDEQQAVQQAIRKALITPRFKCLIYDDQYGSQIEDAVTCNDATREYVRSVVPGFVEDCLLPDTRILGVSNFELEFRDDGAYISFDADTIFGQVTVQEVI